MITLKSTKYKLLIVIVFGFFAGCAAYLYAGPSSGDDTFIYMRYVQNALNGNGYVYNVGDHSYGCTSSAWPILMTPVVKLLGNTLWTWKISSTILFGIRASLLLYMLFQFNIGFMWQLVLALVGVLEPHTFRWSGSGMESSLTLLVLTVTGCSYWLYITKPSYRRSILLGLLISILPFVRPETILISLGIASYVICVQQKKALKFCFLASSGMTLFACWLATYLSFGSSIPQTAEAKAIFLHQAALSYGLIATLKIVMTGSGACLVLLLILKGNTPQSVSWKGITLFALLSAICYLTYKNQLIGTRYASYLCDPIILATIFLLSEKVSVKAD